MTFYLNKVEKKSTKNLIRFDSECVGSVIGATRVRLKYSGLI